MFDVKEVDGNVRTVLHTMLCVIATRQIREARQIFLQPHSGCDYTKKL